MSIGLLRGTVMVEKHNPEWEIIAKDTIVKLKNILQDVAVDLQHIGSTSIEGIVAKPIIDIVIGVNNLEDILKMNNVLEENGFIFRGQDHPDQYLYICGSGDFITHHIHVTKFDSETWNNYIDLRDYLNAHPKASKDYSSLKEELAKHFSNDRKIYTSKKSDFINSLLINAKRWKNNS